MTIIKSVLADAIQVQDVSLSGLPNPAPNINPSFKISDLLTGGGFNLINFAFIIIGLIFFANLVMSGWDYMMSTGDSKKVGAANTRLINSFIGLIMAVVAFLIVKLITSVLGLENLI